MNIEVYPTVEQAEGREFQDRVVVIIDVLRATSSIIAALEGGARGVIPVNSMDTAIRIAGRGNRKSKILVGERNGLPIEGFDLFNSPTELVTEMVELKTVVLFTSNGTRAIDTVDKARRLLICSINNVDAVAEEIEGEKDIAIICSGSEGNIAAEDLLCCGILLGAMGGYLDLESIGDAGRIALFLYHTYSGEIEKFLMECDRGRQLLDIGYREDVEYCSKRNITSMVPEMKENIIRPGKY
jgi:2-phosphosulfolactate phosphatase